MSKNVKNIFRDFCQHRDNSQGKASQGKLLNVSFQYCKIILFKLDKLMVAIGKKLAPGDHEFNLKNLPCKFSLAISYSQFSSNRAPKSHIIINAQYVYC